MIKERFDLINLQLLEYELEVIECEKLLKFYRARPTLSYTRVWSLYWQRIFIKLTEDFIRACTTKSDVHDKILTAFHIQSLPTHIPTAEG